MSALQPCHSSSCAPNVQGSLPSGHLPGKLLFPPTGQWPAHHTGPVFWDIRGTYWGPGLHLKGGEDALGGWCVEGAQARAVPRESVWPGRMMSTVCAGETQAPRLGSGSGVRRPPTGPPDTHVWTILGGTKGRRFVSGISHPS